jgi:hypothetical protein
MTIKELLLILFCILITNGFEKQMVYFCVNLDCHGFKNAIVEIDNFVRLKIHKEHEFRSNF